MAWFKVDDQFWSHPKVMALSDSAVALWVRAGSYCAQHMTDGVVPDAALRLLGTKQSASELEANELWERTEIGWRFHDWHTYQPTSREVAQRRKARSEAGRKGGIRSGETRSKHRSKHEASASPFASHVASHTDEANTNPVPVPVPNNNTSNEVLYRPQSSDSDPGATQRRRQGPRETQLPQSWTPTPDHIERARSTGLSLDREAAKFRAHAEEHGRKAKNWNSAFTRWLINAAEFQERDQGRPVYRSQAQIMADERARASAADYRQGSALALIEGESA